jgi:hypothetical protein
MRVDLSYGAQFVKDLGHQLAAIQKFFSAVYRIVVDLVVHQALFCLYCRFSVRAPHHRLWFLVTSRSLRALSGI